MNVMPFLYDPVKKDGAVLFEGSDYFDKMAEFQSLHMGQASGSLKPEAIAYWPLDNEDGESNGPRTGDIRLLYLSDDTLGQLHLRENNNGGEGVKRTIDLQGAQKAALTIAYKKRELNSSSDYVTLSVSSTGSDGPWKPLHYFSGPAEEEYYSTVSFDISAYNGSNTAIKLQTSPNMRNTSNVLFDKITVECK